MSTSTPTTTTRSFLKGLSDQKYVLTVEELRGYTHKTQCFENGSNSTIMYPQGSRKKV